MVRRAGLPAAALAVGLAFADCDGGTRPRGGSATQPMSDAAAGVSGHAGAAGGDGGGHAGAAMVAPGGEGGHAGAVMVATGGAGGGSCPSTCTVGASACATSTSLGSCAAGSDGCSVESTAACGGRLVCERAVSASCADPWWAEWPVPPTTRPDGYTDNGDGTVTDGATGLMWEKTGAAATMSQPAAIAYCATMATTGGHNDWRLPAKIELLSIVDYERWNPSMNPIFTRAASDVYWSSVPYAATSSSAWAVNFGYGFAYFMDMALTYQVRCVR